MASSALSRPWTVQTGKMRGFVVYPVGSGTPLRQLGLSPADLITAINGHATDDPKRASEILAQIQSPEFRSVTIGAQNQKMDLVLNIAAATQELSASGTAGRRSHKDSIVGRRRDALIFGSRLVVVG